MSNVLFLIEVWTIWKIFKMENLINEELSFYWRLYIIW
jgi:hypothetical protein